MNEIWEAFLPHIDEFEKYMGYGKEVIEKIGIDKFLAAMDWRNVSDVMKWRTDVVKIIPCNECMDGFTTFQNDFGVCDKCKHNFKIDKFKSDLRETLKKSPADAGDMMCAFAYSSDARDIYRKNRSFKDIVKDCIFVDFLSGNYTKENLLKIAGDRNLECSFIKIAESFEISSKMNDVSKTNYKLIKAIIDRNDLSKANKITRLEGIFKK